MNRPYSAYAAIYDRVGQARFGSELAQLTLQWLAEHGEYPGSVLDLATGTGAAALAFARHGLDTAGLDRSPEMLEAARRKSREAGLLVTWRLGELTSFTMDHEVDLVTSFFDSLNYLLTEAELLDTFRSVARALAPGGWFVFDLNTLYRYGTAWNNTTEIAYQDDNTLVIYRSSFDPRTGVSPLILTAFERAAPEEDLWRRWDEQHDERGYLLQDVQSLLQEAGLSTQTVEQLNERTMTFEGPATERSARAVFFARKPRDLAEDEK